LLAGAGLEDTESKNLDVLALEKGFLPAIGK
jgi:hypothetical protein